jgi:hypothetical protein
MQVLAESGAVDAEKIQQALGISQATAYREMQALKRQGLVEKVPGGICLPPTRSPEGCLQCGKENNPRLVFTIHTQSGIRLQTCCAHCGFLSLKQPLHPESIMTADFLYGTMLNATQAWYVLHSRVAPCCAPSALAFGKEEDALSFAQAFGGQVYPYAQAQAQTQKMMLP